jgi:beta-galactosidase
MWPSLMKRSVEAGLNTIETYVFWGLHEPIRGQYDFTNELDLHKFITVAQEHGLNVIVRIGPYICAEINYGGFPEWLRSVPGMRIRTYNEPFMKEMAKYVSLCCWN